MQGDTHCMWIWVHVPHVESYGWRWERWDRLNPAGKEPVSGRAEAENVLRAFGRAISRILPPKEAERFSIVAYRAETGEALGRDDWHWDAKHGVWEPHGEPWVPGIPE